VQIFRCSQNYSKNYGGSEKKNWGDWLRAAPVTALGLRKDDESVRISCWPACAQVPHCASHTNVFFVEAMWIIQYTTVCIVGSVLVAYT
jgi:hypothetical protein